jgi:hypothetical protein
METPCVKYHIQNRTPIKAYAIEFALHALGYRAEQASFEGCSLCYGNRQRAGVICIPDAPEHGPLWREALDPDFDCGPILPFDIVNAIAMLLADAVNRYDGSTNGASKPRLYDPHDRLVYTSSWQSENGCGDIPVVNAYVLALGKVILRQIPGTPLPLWPQGKVAAIGLSHDVDRLDAWSEVKGCSQRPGLAYLLDAARSLVRNTIRRHDDLELFRDVIRYESDLGFRSTFMFASRNRYSEYGDSHDVAYDISCRKMRPLFEFIQSSGFEIGLHSSYNAREDASRFLSERQRLEELTGATVAGQRHHFWHTSRLAEATLRQHEEAGFTYDSSIAFNDHLGFRRNVALPYYPWLPERNAAVTVMELPVFCMDGNVFSRPGQTGADQADRICALAKTLKRYRGVGVVDWHSDTSNPETPGYRAWGACYFAVLRAFADDSSLWVANLGELATWIQQRQSKLENRQDAVRAG